MWMTQDNTLDVVSQDAFTRGQINHCVEAKVGSSKNGSLKFRHCVLWGIGRISAFVKGTKEMGSLWRKPLFR